MTTSTARGGLARGACNSTSVIHNGGRRGHWERTERNHVRICGCGYATPVTTKLTAAGAFAAHVCREDTRQLELPFDLPAVATSAVVRYIADRRTRGQLNVDTAVVLRFAGGDHTLRLNPLERIAVYALLRARGASKQSCMQLLRLSWSTQARYRRLVEAAA